MSCRRDRPEAGNQRIDRHPRIFICWQAQDQQGYQVQIGDRIFPEQYGTEKQWRCPVYLEDGCYTVKVRVQNAFGRWSLWASAQAVIQNKESGKIFLTGRAVGWEILLSWSFVGDFAGFLFKKDGKVIAETKETAFCDRLCCTKHQYEIIGQTKNGYYVSSGVRTEIFSMSGAAMSGLSGGKWIPLQVRREGAPAHRMESTAQVVYPGIVNGFTCRRLKQAAGQKPEAPVCVFSAWITSIYLTCKRLWDRR